MVNTSATSPPASRTASTAFSAELPVVVTSSTITTRFPLKLSPFASVISPRPNERLRMISARRAREADLDKVFSLGLCAGAIYRRTRAHARAEIDRQQAHVSSSAKADDPVFRGAGCKAETFRSTGYRAFAGY